MMRTLTVLAGVVVGGSVACSASAPSATPDLPPQRALKLIWADEFTGPRGRRLSDRRWRYEYGGRWGASELQYYTPRSESRPNAALDGRGHLAITARRETYTEPDGTAHEYTSARLSTHHRFAFAYGRVDARIRVVSGQGLISGFWALGADIDAVGWPQSGEFDIVEVLGSRPAVALGSIHGPDDYGAPYAVNTEHEAAEPLDRRFHVYSVSWTPHRLEFFLDGTRYATYEPASLAGGNVWSFEHPFYLVLTLSVGGRWAGPPDESTKFPATMLVDWIRVRRNRWTHCPTVAVKRSRNRCPARP